MFKKDCEERPAGGNPPLTLLEISSLQKELKQLRSEKEFYETILNEIPADIVVFDSEHKYIFASSGAIKNKELRVFIIGKDDFEYAQHRNWDDAVAKFRRSKFNLAKSTGKEASWEDTIIDSEGKSFTSLRRLFPVKNDGGHIELMIGYGIDISDRKIIEKQKEDLVDKLSIRNDQLVDFCNIIAHNLRGPVNNVGILFELLEEVVDLAEMRELCEQVAPILNKLNSTFDDLIESLQVTQDSSVTCDDNDFSECLSEVLIGLSAEIKKYQVAIQQDFSIVPNVRFPNKYLSSILYNLISNSIKYHSPKRRLKIDIGTQYNQGRTLLKVADNGLGIDIWRNKDQLFKMGKTFHGNEDAKGYGLYMTKTQVECMGGKIWLESDVNVGTTFFVEF